MFSTNLLEDAAIQPAVNAAKGIPAQNVHGACPGKLVRESFDQNCRLHITPGAQEMRPFSENCHAALFSLRSLCRCREEIAEELQKSDWIRHAIKHEC